MSNRACGMILACAIQLLIAGAAHAQRILRERFEVQSGEIHVAWDTRMGFPEGAPAGDSRQLWRLPLSSESSLSVETANSSLMRVSAGELRGALNGTRVWLRFPDADYPDDRPHLVSSDGSIPACAVMNDDYQFDPLAQHLSISGRLVVTPAQSSKKAAALATREIGTIRVDLTLAVAEAAIVDHDVPIQSVLFANPTPDGDENQRGGPNVGIVDCIVGDIPDMQLRGRSFTQAAVNFGTSSCNKGTLPLNFFALPATDHPLIAQNMYRLKNDRLEMIGQAWVKHAFGAAQFNQCGFGCTPGCADMTRLCGGCSDPYNSGLNGYTLGLGSRAWIQPYTGAFSPDSNDHTDHEHDGRSHRCVINDDDLAQELNGNDTALYFAEAHYITPHEYNHLPSRQAGALWNNVSYRRFSVTGSYGSTYEFAPIGATVREQPALNAWTGAAQSLIEPAPGQDGRAFLAYKVTNNGDGTWHYEFALYNMNLDRAIGSFAIPIGAYAAISNVGFHCPPQHPGFPNDGTAGNAGYSEAPWSAQVLSDRVLWATESIAQNQNANALRWGTLYNFRFDADQPPQSASASVGYFKTGSPSNVAAQGPRAGTPPPCPGDLNQDRSVDLADLTELLAHYGEMCSPTACAADLDRDGEVGFADLTILLAAYGTICP